MEIAINSVVSFMILYFIYYYVLRFVQSVFQSSVSGISSGLSHVLYAISTPAHELAHLIMAVLCGAHISEVKLFPSKSIPGYVKFSLGSKYPFVKSLKEFFIGIGPALINIPLFIFVESRFILKINNYKLDQILNPRFLITKEGVLTLILFLILIGGIAPSYADLKGMVKGVIILSIVIFAAVYFGGAIINIKRFDISSLINLVLYYLEIISFFLLVNMMIHYRNWYRVLYSILKGSIKHTFSKS